MMEFLGLTDGGEAMTEVGAEVFFRASAGPGARADEPNIIF